MDIAEVLKERIMVMDGAMGTMLQQNDLRRRTSEVSEHRESSDIIEGKLLTSHVPLNQG